MTSAIWWLATALTLMTGYGYVTTATQRIDADTRGS